MYLTVVELAVMYLNVVKLAVYYLTQIHCTVSVFLKIKLFVLASPGGQY